MSLRSIIARRKPNKGQLALIAAVYVLVGVLAPAHDAHAIFGFLSSLTAATFGLLFAGIIYAIAAIIGLLISVTLIPMLMFLVRYNDFGSEYGVELGWMVIRDVSNMFFIVVLLVIAVATIFKIESYSYRQLLPKLVLMAVLINFSKSITLFFIDISQIVMLTFVNGFKDIAAGNLLNATGVAKIFDFDTLAQTIGDNNFTQVLGALLMGLAIVVVTAGVLVVFIVIFVVRIVMLWILIVLSPLAYILSILPGAQRYASQWWEKFIPNLITGPVLAFFLWLSFTIMQNNLYVQRPGSSFEQGLKDEQAKIEKFDPFNSEVTRLDSMMNFVIVIALLMGSLMMAQQIGGAAASFAGTVSGKLRGLGKAALIAPALGAKSFGSLAARKIKAGEWFGGFEAETDEHGNVKTYKDAQGNEQIKYKRTGLAGYELNPFNIYKHFKEAQEGKKEKQEVSGMMATAETMKGDDKQGKAGGVKRMLAALGSRAGMEILTHDIARLGGVRQMFKFSPAQIAQLQKDIQDSESSVEQNRKMAGMEDADKNFYRQIKQEYEGSEEKLIQLEDTKKYIVSDAASGEIAVRIEKEKKKIEAAEKRLEQGGMTEIQRSADESTVAQGAATIKELEETLKQQQFKWVSYTTDKDAEGRTKQQRDLERKNQEISEESEKYEAAKAIYMRYHPEVPVGLDMGISSADKKIADLEAAKAEAANPTEEEAKKGIDPKKQKIRDDAIAVIDKKIGEIRNKQLENIAIADEVRRQRAGRTEDDIFAAAKQYFEEKAQSKSDEAARIEKGGLSDAQIVERKTKALQLEDKRRGMLADFKAIYTNTGKDVPAAEMAILEKIDKDLKELHPKDAAGNPIEEEKWTATEIEKDDNAKSHIVEKLNKEAEELKLQGSYRITGAQRELYRQEAEKGEANIKEKKHDLEKQVAFIPQDYYAIREARAKVSEESRKIETENEEELISMFRSALERKDQFLAAAIAQQASRVGHLNELIADFGEEGNNQFDQNGFNGFINKNFIGKLGMNRQWAYALQNDYSDTAQQIGHWTFSQAVGMKNGQYVQRTLEQQRERMTGEAGKKNFEGRMRDNNRLGGWYTEYAGPSGRQSVLNEFGLMEIETHFKNLPELIRRNRFNDNSLVNLWTDENKRLLSELKRTRIKPADYAQFDEFMRSVELRLGETSEGVRPSQMLAPHRRLKQSIGARFA